MPENKSNIKLQFSFSSFLIRGQRWFISIYFLVLFCVYSPSGFSQQEDSVVKSKPKFVFSFDARRSFVASQNARIGGIKIGLEYNGEMRYGLGIYNLATPFYRNVLSQDSNGNYVLIHTKFSFGYVSPYAEYVWINHKKWEVSVPIQIGFGSIGLDYADGRGNYANVPVMVLEPSINAHYKFFPWVGVGAGVGYRWTISGDKTVTQTFSSPIYIIKLKVFVGYIYRKIFPKKKE